MGLFNRNYDQEEALAMAEKLAAGKGVFGKLTKMTMGSENMEKFQSAIGSARSAQDAQAALAAGAVPQLVTVTSLQDTGQLINFDPVVILQVAFEDGSSQEVRTLVSKLQIPRPGDQVFLLRAQDGSWLYAGPAS